MTQDMLHHLGACMVKEIIAEAKKDIAMQGGATRPGVPEGLPDSSNFLKSFSYRIVGRSTVEIISTWPYIEQLTEGKPSGPMKHLTREGGGPKVVPMIQNGTVVFRTTPLQTKDAWIHPGYARHTFLQRGIRKGREKAAQEIAREAMDQIRKGDPLR